MADHIGTGAARQVHTELAAAGEMVLQCLCGVLIIVRISCNGRDAAPVPVESKNTSVFAKEETMVRQSTAWLAMSVRLIGVLTVVTMPLPAWALNQSVPAIRADAASLADYQVGGNVVDGSGVKVAIIDTEVKFAAPATHPALVGRIESMSDYSGEGLLANSTTFFDYASGAGPNNHFTWVNDFHGTATAGVVAGTGLDSAGAQTGHKGVAPGATLGIGKMWTSQLVKSGVNDNFGINAALELTSGTRRIALIEDQSFAPTVANGSSNFALALDYLAWARDVTVVIPAGNAGPNNAQFSIPADAFNGLAVGATDATFNQVADFSNQGTTGDGRRKPEVLAPGAAIDVPFSGYADADGRDASAAYNYNFQAAAAGSPAGFLTGGAQFADDADPDFVQTQGTSFSGPHVAGQAALLRQYGVDRGFDLSNEVMKAVIVNSADKLDDVLESNRTITDRTGNSWLASAAYNSQTQTLDNQMGAGQVDVWRSFKQYAAGEHGPGAVPAIGWDVQAMGAEDDFFDYVFDDQIAANTFLSATLTWDRKVTFTDVNANGLLDLPADSFTASLLDDLNLYLMQADEDNIANAIWSSRSSVDNLEHIFFPVQQTDNYKLRVVFADDQDATAANFGLAWWTAVVPEPGAGLILVFGSLSVLAGRRRRQGGA
jgi:subtilisin family serine protease